MSVQNQAFIIHNYIDTINKDKNLSNVKVIRSYWRPNAGFNEDKLLPSRSRRVL